MITYDELKKIAALAKLSLDNVDTDELAADMAGIMEVANSIDDLDLSSLDCSGDADAAARIEPVRGRRLRDDLDRDRYGQ